MAKKIYKKKYYSEIEPGSKLTTVFDFNSSTVPSNFSNTRALELANQNGNPNEFVFDATTDVANSRQALNVVAPINGNYTPRNHLFVTGSPGVEQGMRRHAYQEYDPRGVLVAKMSNWEPYVRPEIEGGVMFTKKYDPYVDRTSGFTTKNSSYEAGLGYFGGSFAPYVKLNPTLTYRMRPDSWQPEPPQKIDESDLYLARYMRDHPGYDNVGMFKPVGIDVSGDLDIRNTIPAGGDEATLYDYNRMGNAWNTGAQRVGANIGAKLLTASGINPYVKLGVNYNPELTQKFVPSATVGVNSVITNKGNKRRYIPVEHEDGGWINKYAEGGVADVENDEMSVPEPMAPDPARHKESVKNKKRILRKNKPVAANSSETSSSIIEPALPADKHLLAQVPIAAEPTYSPDYIEPWESWNFKRWHKWDYSDYPTQELANASALKKLGADQDYVYKKQIFATKAAPEKKQDPGTSATYDEAYNKYYNFVKENEGTVKDQKTGLFIPYPSPEGDGTYTVGYGHKLKKGQENDPMFKNGLTEEQVSNLFKNDFQTNYGNVGKFLGEDYFTKLPYDQQMMFVDYNFNTKKGLRGFPKFVDAIQAYNNAGTEEEKQAQREIIAKEYSRKFTDEETKEDEPLYKRNSSMLDKYLIPSFKIKRAMTEPEKYTHPGIKEPYFRYGMVQPDNQEDVAMAKHGGWLDTYEKGNIVYVSSATDPRYKRYKDSLDLYNYYKLQTQLENPSGGRMPGAGQGHEYNSVGDVMNTLSETGNTLYNMYSAVTPLTDEQKKNDEYLFKVASDIIKNNPDLTWGTDFPGIGEENYQAYKNAPEHSPDIKTKDGSIKATGTWMGYARNNNYANVKPSQTVVVAPPMSLKKGDVYKTQYGEYEIVSNPTPGASIKLKNKKTGQESEVNYQDMASHVYNKDASVSTPTQQKTPPPPAVKKTTTTVTATTPTQQAETKTTTTTTPSTQTTQTVKKTTAPFKPKTGGFYAEDGTYWRFDEKGNLVPAAKNTNQGYKYGGKTWLDKYK